MAHKKIVKKEGYSLAKLQKIVVLHWRPNLPKDKKVQDLSNSTWDI